MTGSRSAPARLALAAAVVALLAPRAARAVEPQVRQFVPQSQRQAVYPGVRFQGDVRVERGVKIAPGATVTQTGTKPLYLLGNTTIGPKSRVAQEGDRPLVLLHTSTGEQGIVSGRGTTAHTTASGSLDLAGGRAQRSTIQGTLGAFSGLAHNATVTGTLGGKAVVRDSSVSGIATGHVVVERSRVEGLVLGTADGKPHRVEGQHVPSLEVSGGAAEPVRRSSETVSPTERYEVVQVGSMAQGRVVVADQMAHVNWSNTDHLSGAQLVEQLKGLVHRAPR